MKFSTIDTGQSGHPAVLFGDAELLDLTAYSARSAGSHIVPPSVRGILETGDKALEVVRSCLDEVDTMSEDERAGLREEDILRDLAGTPLNAPIPDPRLIMSAGLNYGRHLDEMSGTPRPSRPTAFIKAASTLTGSGKPIIVPPQCADHIDFEGEFTFVFGRPCHRVSIDEAFDYVAGYTIVNDVSARDWVPEVFKSEGTFGSIQAWERNIMGKQLPTFSPSGPFMVTKDEIDDPHDLQLTTTLNGKVMQSTKTDDLIFKVHDLISYFSEWYQFLPGDLFTTGSPAGVGFGRDPQVFMKAGDVIEVEAEGIGKLSNTLVSEGV
ncbi:MAG: fumarylacetoacetate hydrolase family protein [Rhodospirillales bacterium]|nr:fumarylacetoacetate hydrolase family protein [Rhodospirillales bacterium]